MQPAFKIFIHTEIFTLSAQFVWNRFAGDDLADFDLMYVSPIAMGLLQTLQMEINLFFVSFITENTCLPIPKSTFLSLPTS